MVRANSGPCSGGSGAARGTPEVAGAAGLGTVHAGDDRGGANDVVGDVYGRLAWVDLLRGLAIASMVAANAGAQVLRAPHPLAFRLLGSLAAPTFVTLAGMMVAHATRADRSPRGSGTGRP